MKAGLPNLNALLAFDTVAREGSLVRAAEVLNVTHGAVSRQLRQLEEDLGVALFERQGRGLRLTRAGHALRESSLPAFHQLREGCEQVRLQSRDQPFVLGCPASLLARWFIPRMDQLQQALPELQLQLSPTDGDPDPRRSGVDAALWFAEPPWPEDLQVLPLQVERIGPVVSPHYAGWSRLRDQPVECLLDEPVLHTRSRTQAWPLWFSRQGLAAQPPHYGQGFEHLYFLLEAALAGLGVAIAPQLLVAQDLASGRLLAPWGFMETSASLTLWQPARLADPRGRALADWLQQALSA